MSGSDQYIPVRTPRRRRTRRLIKLAVLLVLAGWFTHFAYTRITRKPTPRPEYWIRQLEALYTPRPGAMTVDEANQILYADNWGPRFPLYSWNGDPGSEFRYGRIKPFRESYPDPLVNDLVLFILEPLEFDKSYDDLSPRCDEWLAKLCLSRFMSTPLAAEWETRLLAALQMRSAAEWGAAVPQTVLPRLCDEIMDHPITSADLLQRIRLPAMAQLEEVYVREGGWMDVPSLIHQSDEKWNRENGPLSYSAQLRHNVSRVWNLASPLFDSLETSQVKLNALLAPAEGCRTIVDCERLLAPGALPDAEAPFTILNGLEVPCDRQDLIRLVRNHLESQTSLEAGLTMLALSAFHREHGKYPERLDDLVPALLTRLPTDYADGATFRYRRTDDGKYLLYSVGLNGADNGGSWGIRNRSFMFEAENSDVVFSPLPLLSE